MSDRISQRVSRPNEVGATIRRFRERAQLSTRELARRTGVAASYVSKVELGQLGVRPEFCRRVARVLGLPSAERDLLGVLLALQRAEHCAVPSGTDALQEAQQAVRRLERGCRACRVFQLSLIPGLLQTREYMQSIFSRLTSPARARASVPERLARQRILVDQGRSFRFLISDWALAPHWCSDRVLAAELAHLRKLSKRPNIEIRIMPHDVHFPKDVPPLVSGFEILDDALVIVDTLTGFTTFRQPEEVGTYVGAFDRVFSQGKRIRNDESHGGDGLRFLDR